MNSKIILTGLVVLAAIVSIAILSQEKPNESEILEDQLVDNIKLDLVDSPEVSQSLSLDATGINYTVDEDGNIHYKLDLIDSPEIKP